MPVQNNKKIRLQQKLERSILHGLSCEWDAALWNLEKEHRGLMKKPLLSLKDMKNKLGYWSGDKRVICLNRNFVLTRPWDDICDVFFHEIAHQFSEEVLGAFQQMVNFQTLRTQKELWSNSKNQLQEIFRILKMPFIDTDISVSYIEGKNQFKINYENYYQGLFKKRLELITVLRKFPSEERLRGFRISPPRDYDTFRPNPLIYRAP